jgi:hypothetical protein
MLIQTPEVIRLMPLMVVEGEDRPEEHEVLPLYEFEPSASDVLDALLPRYVYSRIYFCLLQAAASELASRQRAMKAATDNAEDRSTSTRELPTRPARPGSPRKSARSSVGPTPWPTRTPGVSERDDCHA